MKTQIWNFRTNPEQLDGLREVLRRDGIPIAEQIRRAIDAWLEAKDARVKPRKAVTRKKR